MTPFRFLLLALASLTPLLASAFNPNLTGNVYTSAIQTDGKIVFGGSFVAAQPSGLGAPVERLRLARFNVDGSLDTAFSPAFDGDVVTVALQSDGRILVGGKFTQVISSGGGAAYARSGLARLLADGTVDPTFDPRPSGGAASTGQVSTIAIEASGSILIGGAFTALQPGGSGTSYARSRLARLTAAGDVDTGFTPAFNNLVVSLLPLADGRILVGGGFTAVTPTGATAATTVGRMVRLHADGTLDSSFAASFNNRVNAFALESDGSILVGGDFTTVTGSADSEAITHNFLVRLSSGGARDADFLPRPSAAVYSIKVQRDGRILLGGEFTSFYSANTGYSTTAYYLARVNADGSVDTGFSPGVNALVNTLSLQSDGKIVLGGLFTRLTPSGASSSVQRSHAARLQSSGDLDGDFAAGEDGSLLAAATDSSGRLLVGGSFTTLAGLTRYNLARVAADGSVDASFAPVVNGAVYAVALQSDGKILLGGAFTEINDTEIAYLARLNADGSLDTSFQPGPSSYVYTILPQSDGRLLVGGNFYAWDTDDGQADDDDGDGETDDDMVRQYFAQLESTGKVTSLAWEVDAPVNAIAQQSDGKILIGGSFTSVLGKTRYYVARVNPGTGAPDEAINPGVNSTVSAIAVQTDGKILLAGSFSTAQLDDGEADDDDEDDSTDDDADRVCMLRLNADGTLDRTFNPEFNRAVSALHLLSDGRIVAAGAFTTVGADDTARRFVAVLASSGALDPTSTVQTNDRASAIAASADGSVYIVGRFTSAYTAAGESVSAENHIVRLASTGGLETTWSVRASNTSGAAVLAMAEQADGKLVLGGQFSELAGQETTHLTRLTAAGYRDTSWTTSTDGAVRALVVEPLASSAVSKVNLLAWLESSGTTRTAFGRSDISNLAGRINAVLPLADGSLLVGGSFTVTGATTYKHLVRFKADGTLDTAFNPLLDSSVAALATQSDGKIIVGGAFTVSGGTTRYYVLRLNTDLSLDTSFAPPSPNGAVAALAIQSDNAIVLGGSFTAFELDDGQSDDDDGDGTTNDDTGRAYIARLNADGTLDKTYNPTANGSISALLLMPEDRILVGGSFTGFTPNGASSSTSRNYVALINTGGLVNDSFKPEPNAAVAALARQSDGKILLGGYFGTLQLDDGEADDDDEDDSTDDDADRSGIARLNADYTLDKTFKPETNGGVLTIAVHPDGRILLGGYFTTLEPEEDNPITRRYVAALTSAGAITTDFNPAATAAVYTIVVLPDSSFVIAGAFDNLLSDPVLYIGGDFATVADLDLPRLARLTADGSPDGGFRPAPNGAVHAMAAQADGGILVGGDFTAISGAARTRLARYTLDGIFDTAFAPAFDGAVRALAVAPTGLIYVGGEFATAGGASRRGLARVTAAGAVDAGFGATVNGTVLAVAIAADGGIVIGGDFTQVNGVARRYLARFTADGTLDATFDPSPDGVVRALSARVDGTLLVGGDFAAIASQSRARLAVLKATGALDATFSADANGSVHSVAGMLDGRTFVGGAFTAVGTSPDYLISRVTGVSSGGYSFAVGSGMQSAAWTLSGNAPVYSSVALSYSTNGNLWNALGSASLSSDGKTWQWSGSTTLPANTAFLLRARAVTTAAGGGASGVTEVYWQFYNTQAAGAVTIGQPDDGSSGGGDDGGSSGGGSGGSGSGTGSVTLSGPVYAATVNGTSAGYLSDFSALLRLQGSEVKFVNFVITGSTSRRMFLRVAGPGLASIAVTDYAKSPRLELYTSAGALWVAAATPVADSTLVTTAAALGALPLTVGSADAAVVTTLTPGSYVAAIWDAAGAGGAVLTELFEVDGSVPSGLVAASSRATSAANTGAQSVEFTIKGTTSRNVLIRGLGPALTAQGLTGANANPALILQNSAGTTVATNDDWETPVTGTLTPATATQLTLTTSNIGATALATGSKDAAILVSLTPGTYTAAVAGSGSATGFTEIEVYDVPVVTSTTPDTDDDEDEDDSTSSGGGGSPSAVGGALLGALLLARAWRRQSRAESN